jgi:hypothetical protein
LCLNSIKEQVIVLVRGFSCNSGKSYSRYSKLVVDLEDIAKILFSSDPNRYISLILNKQVSGFAIY